MGGASAKMTQHTNLMSQVRQPRQSESTGRGRVGGSKDTLLTVIAGWESHLKDKIRSGWSDPRSCHLLCDSWSEDISRRNGLSPHLGLLTASEALQINAKSSGNVFGIWSVRCILILLFISMALQWWSPPPHTLGKVCQIMFLRQCCALILSTPAPSHPL